MRLAFSSRATTRNRGRKRRRDETDYRWPLMLGGAALCGVFSLSWFGTLRLFDTRFDFFSLYVLWFVLFGDDKRGRYVPSMLMGLVRDLLSAGVFGSYAIIYGCLHRVLAGNRKLLYREHPIMQVVIAFVAIVAVNMGYFLTLSLAHNGIGWSVAFERSLMTAVITAPLFAPLCWVMSGVMKVLDVEEIPGHAWRI